MVKLIFAIILTAIGVGYAFTRPETNDCNVLLVGALILVAIWADETINK